jgi:hypothetical protein
MSPLNNSAIISTAAEAQGGAVRKTAAGGHHQQYVLANAAQYLHQRFAIHPRHRFVHHDARDIGIELEGSTASVPLYAVSTLYFAVSSTSLRVEMLSGNSSSMTRKHGRITV